MPCSVEVCLGSSEFADNSLVYTTPAPKGTLSNAAINGARRATENLSRPTTSSDAAASGQQRQSSAPVQQRPVTSSSPKTSSPLAPNAPSSTPTIRTSYASDMNPPNPSYSSMNMQSPVMNETLSVINEHITDMNVKKKYSKWVDFFIKSANLILSISFLETLFLSLIDFVEILKMKFLVINLEMYLKINIMMKMMMMILMKKNLQLLKK